MTDSNLNNFDPADFLAKAGLGRTILYVQAKETRFRKGTRPTPSSIFKGSVKVTVVSQTGKKLPSRFSRLATYWGGVYYCSGRIAPRDRDRHHSSGTALIWNPTLTHA
jgi:hypothetical protein